MVLNSKPILDLSEQKMGHNFQPLASVDSVPIIIITITFLQSYRKLQSKSPA